MSDVRVVDCYVCSEAVDAETGIGLAVGGEIEYIHEWCVDEYKQLLANAIAEGRYEAAAS